MKWAREKIQARLNGRLPRYLYALATKLAPVACVDVLPWRCDDEGFKVGLIQRLDEKGEVSWCFVGGRVHRSETLEAAIARHIHDTLGDKMTWAPIDYAHPATIGEYFPDFRPGESFDPRKHSLGISYPVELSGEASAQGEAFGFTWFSPEDLPLQQMGFGQDRILRSLHANSKLRELFPLPEAK